MFPSVASIGANPWVTLLDGRDLLAAGARWRVQVFGISEEAGHRWLQLAIHGPRRYVLTICVRQHDGPGSAFGVLAHWLTGEQGDYLGGNCYQNCTNDKRPKRGEPAGAV